MAWLGYSSEEYRTEQKFILHLVGKIPDDAQLMRFSYQSTWHSQSATIMVLVPMLDRAFFFLVQARCLTCPLKVREYLMLGLPVYGDWICADGVNYFKCRK